MINWKIEKVQQQQSPLQTVISSIDKNKNTDKITKENLHIICNSGTYCNFHHISIDDIRSFLLTMCDNIDNISFILKEASEYLTIQHYQKIQNTIKDPKQILFLATYDIDDKWLIDWIESLIKDNSYFFTIDDYYDIWLILSNQYKDNKIRKWLFKHMYKKRELKHFLDIKSLKSLTLYEKTHIVNFYEEEILLIDKTESIHTFYMFCLIYCNVLTTKIKRKLIDLFIQQQDVNIINQLLNYCNFTDKEINEIKSILNLCLINNH